MKKRTLADVDILKKCAIIVNQRTKNKITIIRIDKKGLTKDETTGIGSGYY